MSHEQRPELPPPYPPSELSPTIARVPPVPRRRWVAPGINLLLGLGLFLVGLPTAWLLGIGAARVVAAPGQQLPFQEIVLRRASRVVTEIYRLPGRWRPSPPPETRIEPIPIPTQPIEPLIPAPAALNEREQQIAQEEIAALQQEFETIQNRLSDLESKLGQAQSTADVESRLANLEDRLGLRQPVPVSTALGPPPPIDKAAEASHPLLEVTELKITLPSDALFVLGEARLLTTAPELLESLFLDLNRYPNATILIGSHTDDRLELPQSVTLTFQQANALRAYLTGHLPDHRWVAIGYGQSQPVADNSTPQRRQRNRRIEIAIDRR
ncbi:MAG: OmpA family protein [Cyanobacteria bacterium P01_D01_bin.2]